MAKNMQKRAVSWCYLAVPDCYLAVPDYYLAVPGCYLAVPDCYLAVSWRYLAVLVYDRNQSCHITIIKTFLLVSFVLCKIITIFADAICPWWLRCTLRCAELQGGALHIRRRSSIWCEHHVYSYMLKLWEKQPVRIGANGQLKREH